MRHTPPEANSFAREVVQDERCPVDGFNRIRPNHALSTVSQQPAERRRAALGRTPRQRPPPATTESRGGDRHLPAKLGPRAAGSVPRTAGILSALHDRGVRLVVLTNWSAETIHRGPEVLPEVFALFDVIVAGG